MKALILAAGFGSRLAPITNNIPKSLVKVNGTPILFKQIQNLIENDITDITIVSGYKSEILEKEVKENFNNIKIIESVDYATTNNMFSAYLGISQMGFDDMLMMNADVFFDSSIIKTLLKCQHPNAIVVDVGNYNEESMKVVQKDNHLVRISKDISRAEALGSSIDVYKFDKNGAYAFFKKCEDYIINQQVLNKWSEVALNDILSEIEFQACPLVGRWYEIDNHEDLKAAEQLFQEKQYQ